MKENREVRDRIAELLGWKKEVARANPWFSGDTDEPGWRHPASGFQYSHPVDNTLDSAAAAMPEGWVWKRIEVSGRNSLQWSASKWGDFGVLIARVQVSDTGDEKADRFALALKCLEASQPPHREGAGMMDAPACSWMALRQTPRQHRRNISSTQACVVW